MLIVPVFINKDLIDKLFCHNQGETNKRGQHLYKVWLESNLMRVEEVWHRRADGWLPLVVKSLRRLK